MTHARYELDAVGEGSSPDVIAAELLSPAEPAASAGLPLEGDGAAPTRRRATVRRGVARLVGAVGSASGWVWGVANLIVGLSVLASLPILQVASLGYLLEVTGRMGREARFRSAWIGVRLASRLGVIALCVWLLLLLPRLLASLTYSSSLINTTAVAPAAENQLGLRLLTGAVAAFVALHIAWALYRGGRLRDFLWPAPVRLLRQLRDGLDWRGRLAALRAMWRSLRFGYYFRLGLKGYLATFIWLLIPLGLMAEGTRRDPEAIGIFVLTGILSTAVVATYLPILQAELGRTGNWRAMFGVRRARELFVRGPWMWWLAITLLLVAALPLYLLKAELIPSELAWFPGLFFVVFMWPARVAAGWALVCSLARERPCHWFWRWTARAGLVGVALFYAGLVYFTPQFSWYGAGSLFEQHAFLVPAPFLKL